MMPDECYVLFKALKKTTLDQKKFLGAEAKQSSQCARVNLNSPSLIPSSETWHPSYERRNTHLPVMCIPNAHFFEKTENSNPHTESINFFLHALPPYMIVPCTARLHTARAHDFAAPISQTVLAVANHWS